VWDEVVFAPRNLGMLDNDVRAHADHLLRQCGLEGRTQDHPYRLSYGQKRRLNLISVLIYRPALVLLDELLIGQDAENAAFLMSLLCEHIAAGGTVILVNHSPEATWCYASRLLFFENGQLAVDAPVQEAFQQLDALGKRAYLPPK
jgi:energy-coupling factor transporter ATP-binding protein EcfA2